MNELAPEVASGKGRADENFPVGSLLISAALRPHVHAYYGFARAIDDIADNNLLSPEAKIARLDAMEAVLLGKPPAVASPDSPAVASPPGEIAHAQRLRASLAVTGVDPRTGTDLIVAFRQDAVKHRYQSWDELVQYCRYSANPVGRYLLALHGEGNAALAASDALCTALQVLNHLQDCADDLASLDRCYLPLSWLAEEGLDVGILRERGSAPGLRRVIDRLLDGVDGLNREAAGLPGLVVDRRMRLEAAVIVGLSHRLAARLRREDPLARRVALRRPDVARSLLGAARFWRRG
jgi:squalene synthase HpnC